jgi:hypothetical protein
MEEWHRDDQCQDLRREQCGLQDTTVHRSTAEQPTGLKLDDSRSTELWFKKPVTVRNEQMVFLMLEIAGCLRMVRGLCDHSWPRSVNHAFGIHHDIWFVILIFHKGDTPLHWAHIAPPDPILGSHSQQLLSLVFLRTWTKTSWPRNPHRPNSHIVMKSNLCKPATKQLEL